MKRKNRNNVDIQKLIVLLVEDDPNDVVLIQRAFRKANIVNPIYIVENGEDAIDYLAGKGKFKDRNKYPIPTLVLLDLKLPRISGHEVLAWVRKQHKLKRLPIVVLTSSQQVADKNKAYDLGTNSYLIKPVSFDSLLELIQSLNTYWHILNEKPEINSGGK